MKLRKEVFLIVIPFFLSVGFICLFLWDNEYISKVNVKKIDCLSSIEKGVKYYIDGIEVKNNKVRIEGWIYKYEPDHVNRKVLLQNIENREEVYELNTSMSQRTDLNEVYKGTNYQYCGFVANGLLSFRMKDKKYEIIIWFNDNNENEIFHTGQICEIGR